MFCFRVFMATLAYNFHCWKAINIFHEVLTFIQSRNYPWFWTVSTVRVMQRVNKRSLPRWAFCQLVSISAMCCEDLSAWDECAPEADVIIGRHCGDSTGWPQGQEAGSPSQPASDSPQIQVRGSQLQFRELRSSVAVDRVSETAKYPNRLL
jgi:hypothetical protein